MIEYNDKDLIILQENSKFGKFDNVRIKSFDGKIPETGTILSESRVRESPHIVQLGS